VLAQTPQPPPQPAPPLVRKRYVAVKGDPIDEMMAVNINMQKYYMSIERISEGIYVWNSKKFFAKIMNNKLIIRVGGGFMNITEFLSHMESELRSTGQLYIFEVDGQTMSLE